MLDEKRAATLQTMYLVSRHPVILVELQREAEAMCRPLISQQLKKTGISFFPKEKINFISYESSTRFMEMYLKNPEWVCRSFAARLNLEVIYHLYNKKNKQLDKLEDISTQPISNPEPVQQEDTRFVIEDIMSDTVYWRNVLMNCYRSKSYRSFILSIEPIVGRRWIYDRAQRLHKLYKNTRRI